MHWILQTNLFNETAYQVLLETLQRLEIPYSIHKIIPFIGELTDPVPEELTDPVICMGSYSMRHAAKKHGWYPGVFDLEPFDYRLQLLNWGEHMLNWDSRIVSFKDAQFTGYAHLRPIEDNKSFAGKVYEDKEFYDWQIKVCVLNEDYGSGLTKESLIQISTVKEIYSEYRFWIVDKKIVTASQYMIGGRVVYSENFDTDLDEFVQAALNVWTPLETFCIDVCRTPDGIKIVEIGTLNSCGFYAANIQKLVIALEESYNE